MSVWDIVASAISEATRSDFTLRNKNPVAGGNINATFRLEGTDGRRYFLKLNDARLQPLFLAEVAGLEAISATNTLRVPRVIAHGFAVGQTFLILEHLEFRSHGDSSLFGAQLARMHRCSADHFGFACANFIGTTPQPNNQVENWVEFWRDQRLGFQLQRAAENGHSGKLQSLGNDVLKLLPAFFEGYVPQPSLLHGDLWNGNCAFLVDGTPALFDPATYYGDRECDIAMTELFGGFHANFYAAYNSVWPLDTGYPARRDVYNLYHLLNHGNMFGGQYMNLAESTIRKLLFYAG